MDSGSRSVSGSSARFPVKVSTMSRAAVAADALTAPSAWGISAGTVIGYPYIYGHNRYSDIPPTSRAADARRALRPERDRPLPGRGTDPPGLRGEPGLGRARVRAHN